MNRKHRVTILAAAARLANIFPFAFGLSQNRLAILHLWPAYIGLHAEFAHHAIDNNFKVQFAHARNERLAGVVVSVNAEGRVFLCELSKRRTHFFLVSLGLWLDRH